MTDTEGATIQAAGSVEQPKATTKPNIAPVWSKNQAARE